MGPLLILISGAPGSGKTTLAQALGENLHLPVFSKDLIKEALMTCLPVRDSVESAQAGQAAFAVLYRITGALIDSDRGVVVEAPFGATSRRELQRVAGRGASVMIHCEVEPSVAAARYRVRAQSGTRHPGHFDFAKLEQLEGKIAAGDYDPPALDVPLLRVDTSHGYRPSLDEILGWIRRQPRPGPA